MPGDRRPGAGAGDVQLLTTRRPGTATGQPSDAYVTKSVHASAAKPGRGPEAVADPIVELTAQGLGNRPAADQWRNLVAVDLSFYTSPLSEELRDEGRAEGLADAILLVLQQRGIDVPDQARERITTCDDMQLMRTWLSRAVTAASTEAVFAEE
ncbi:hypothetical protein GCM10010271_27590 [Streptomyces kurssanovii]|nr:hypothetical protein GCM10010271_27590 [Streptomyces kurssanovii]